VTCPCKHCNENSGSVKGGKFIKKINDSNFPKKTHYYMELADGF
jgi:hypothetical protein